MPPVSGVWTPGKPKSRLKKQAGCTNARIACIGQAGEKLSLISGIANDGGRMAARSGLGAVMGSKRLKALVLCGAARIRSHDGPAIKKLSQKCNESIQFMPPFPPAFVLSYMGAFLRALPAQPNTEVMQFNTIYKIMLKKWGTASLNQILIEIGDSPIKNWQGSNEDFKPQQFGAAQPGSIFRLCGGQVPLLRVSIGLRRPMQQTGKVRGDAQTRI